MSAPVPAEVTVFFVDPEADPSEFKRAIARPDGGFLVVTDLTTSPQRTVMVPAHAIDCVVQLEIEPPKQGHQPLVVSSE